MIEYTVEVHPRARGIKIKVLPNGAVVVVRPKFAFFLPNLDNFVKQHATWILNAQQKALAVRSKKPQNSTELFIFGKKYVRKVLFSAQQPIGIHILANEVRINPVSNSIASIQKAEKVFLKSTAEKYIVPRTHELAKKMNIRFASITLRQQKTRWGSCSSSGNLNFNWQLVHSPPEVIDYVIIHELAHRKQMNHSQKFWEIVAMYDPEHQKHRGWLKRQGMDLG